MHSQGQLAPPLPLLSLSPRKSNTGPQGRIQHPLEAKRRADADAGDGDVGQADLSGCKWAELNDRPHCASAVASC